MTDRKVETTCLAHNLLSAGDEIILEEDGDRLMVLGKLPLQIKSRNRLTLAVYIQGKQKGEVVAVRENAHFITYNRDQLLPSSS